VPLFILSVSDEAMQATYPLYRGPLEGLDFVFYELGYLLFFVVIEFVFRGLLLLGVANLGARDAHSQLDDEGGSLVIGFYAILVATLVYTAWHVGKPTPELLGTLVWGPVAGAVVLGDSFDLAGGGRALAPQRRARRTPARIEVHTADPAADPCLRES
jgi:membrane protease YdiL (CAAX protease family)